MFRYILCWFPMLLLAILNGTFRDLGYKKFTGELTAHQISTVSLLILFGIYIYFVIKRYPPTSFIYAWIIGLIWLTLTLAFEFGFGLARGTSFEIIMKDYQLLNGRLWVLIPLWVLTAPPLFYYTKIARK